MFNVSPKKKKGIYIWKKRKKKVKVIFEHFYKLKFIPFIFLMSFVMSTISLVLTFKSHSISKISVLLFKTVTFLDQLKIELNKKDKLP